MEIRPHRIIKRKITKEIKVGKLTVGGKAPISVQSMTNTLTTDVKETINQIHDLEEAGFRLLCIGVFFLTISIIVGGMHWTRQPEFVTSIKLATIEFFTNHIVTTF